MFTSTKRRIEYLRSTWGKTSNKYRNMDLISNYHNLLKHEENKDFVDEKTWDDLNFDSIYSKVDRTISGVGQQFLYHLLHKYEQNYDKLNHRYLLINNLMSNQQLRENVQLKLFSLRDYSSYYISYILLSDTLPNTKYYPLFYLCSFFSILSLLLIPINGIFVFVALAILLFNIIINKTFANKIYEYFIGFSGINSLITCAIELGNIKTDIPIAELKSLYKQSFLLKSLKKKLGYFVINKESLNELTLIIIEYLNMFMLFDIIAYYRSVNTLLKNRDEMLNVFESVGNLDASISIASYLTEVNYFTKPNFNTSNNICFEDIYHPLIENAVANSVNELASSVLITGSNMSGKTTFLKTIGINFILAQTINISLAKSFSIPKYYVRTSIKRNENLESGKSYFFIEIEELKKLIELSEQKNKYLFLIDEIFRGTNTIERLAASASVLKYLNTQNFVFVTTHDIELQELLGNSYKMYHFSEQVENDKFFFNYKIKEGPCSAGNAIKLLEIMDYPSSITEDAKSTVRELLQHKNNTTFYS